MLPNGGQSKDEREWTSMGCCLVSEPHFVTLPPQSHPSQSVITIEMQGIVCFSFPGMKVLKRKQWEKLENRGRNRLWWAITAKLCTLHSFIQNDKEVEVLLPHPSLVMSNISQSMLHTWPFLPHGYHLSTHSRVSAGPFLGGRWLPCKACLMLHLFPPGFGTAQRTQLI